MVQTKKNQKPNFTATDTKADFVNSLLKKAAEKEPPAEPEKPMHDPKEIEKLVNELKAKAAANYKAK